MLYHKRKIFVVLVAVVLFVGTGFFLQRDFKGVQKDSDSKNNVRQEDEQPENQQKENNNQIVESKESGESGGAKAVPSASGAAVPDLSQPIVIKAKDLPKDAAKIAKKNIEDTIAELKLNNTLFNSWMKLGVLLKITGDYERARDVWEYGSVLAPKNSVSFYNLGDLYWHEFSDFKKAEANYLKAIENKPDAISGYINLSELYFLSYKEKSEKADDILLEGLKNNPNDLNLLKALANYYKFTGNAAKAKEYYALIFKLYPDEIWAKESAF